MNNKSVFKGADILLPKKDFEKWSVVACDQYTSEPDYWNNVKNFVGDTPSALNIILPEINLSVDNKPMINKINTTMKKYIDSDVFNTYEDIMVYTERTLSDGKVRKGIVGLIDLENYSYQKVSDSLIRATEATVIERIPPRVEIRKDAFLEMPHIMLLIDDRNKTVIEPFANKKDNYKKLYDFNLMQNGGHINGYALDKTAQNNVILALNGLIENKKDKLLFAVGDGNHSLAAAKESYNLNKNAKNRYALTEIVNINDDSLQFEPIYRVMFGINPEDVIKAFKEYSGEDYKDNRQDFICLYGKNKVNISVNPNGKLCVATLQKFIDSYIKDHNGVTVDYIHGEEVVEKLSLQPNTLGFIFKGMKKEELFDAINHDGSLPRKTFSMGHAEDKRFYLEARIIK